MTKIMSFVNTKVSSTKSKNTSVCMLRLIFVGFTRMLISYVKLGYAHLQGGSQELVRGVSEGYIMHGEKYHAH